MGKFGFGKKSDGDEDAARSSLFNRKKSPANNDNPYAQQPASDPYGNAGPAYNAPNLSRPGLPSNPGSSSSLPSGPVPRSSYGSPPPPYQAGPQASSGYGNEKFGASAGYGGNRYDAPAAKSTSSFGSQPSSRAGARGPGGYGGLGRADSDLNEPARSELFAGAQARVSQQKPDSGAINGGYGQPGTSSAAQGGYGEPRQLTEEEQEEASIQADKDELNAVRGQSLASLDRSLQSGQAALESMSSTMNRLASQQSRLANTEKKLDYAAISNRIAEEKTTELRRLNRSMFVPAGLSSKKEEELLRKRMEDHVNDRETREATRKDAYLGNRRMEDSMRQLGKPQQLGLARSSASERSKYMFEDDDGEQAAMEDEIDDRMDKLSGMVHEMNFGARLIGDEVDSQNKLIDRIAAKSDAVDDGIRFNREKLNRIR